MRHRRDPARWTGSTDGAIGLDTSVSTETGEVHPVRSGQKKGDRSPACCWKLKEESMSYKGRCLCGHVRYQLASLPEVMGVCHCKDCQRRSGSSFATMAEVERSDFSFSAAAPSIFTGITTRSGNSAEIVFCPRCGSTIYTVLLNDTNRLVINVGTLDDTDWFQPEYHAWTDEKQRWIDVERIQARRERD